MTRFSSEVGGRRQLASLAHKHFVEQPPLILQEVPSIHRRFIAACLYGKVVDQDGGLARLTAIERRSTCLMAITLS
jgi:hypothetical protein